MSTKWYSDIERGRDSDAHVAAMLTSSLIARSSHPCGTSSALEAENAVSLYRCVLAALASQGAPDESLSPTKDSAAMQELNVSRAGVKFRYRTFLYDKLDDALAYARLDRGREANGA